MQDACGFDIVIVYAIQKPWHIAVVIVRPWRCDIDADSIVDGAAAIVVAALTRTAAATNGGVRGTAVSAAAAVRAPVGGRINDGGGHWFGYGQDCVVVEK